MAGEQDIEIEGRAADSLALADSPRLGDEVVLAVVDGEGVVLDGTTGASHLLNVTGALVAQCLDGVTTLEVLCQELADETGAELQQVQDDVLTLVRGLADRGLLAGFRATVVEHEHAETPTLPVGSVLAGLDATAEDGSSLDDGWLGEGDALVVSWGARCGWCTRLAPDLAELAPALSAAGVRILLVTPDDRAAVAEQLGEHAPTLPVGITEELPGWLAGLGTPVGYLTGPGGVTRAPLASGATGVVALVQAVAAGEVPSS